MAVSSITDKADRIVTIAEEVKSPKRREQVHFRGIIYLTENQTSGSV